MTLAHVMLHNSCGNSVMKILTSTFYRLGDLTEATNLVVDLGFSLRLSNSSNHFLKNYLLLPLSKIRDQWALLVLLSLSERLEISLC